MARSLSKSKMFVSLLSRRRGYGAVATAPGVVAVSPDKGGYMAQNKGKDLGKVEEQLDTQPSWAPDPITGIYKPYGSPDICPASLREMVRKLKPRN